MEGFCKVVEVNLMSLMVCVMWFYGMLWDVKGVLIMVFLIVVYYFIMGNFVYNVLKMGVVGLMCILGEVWVEDGIWVNGIVFGFVDIKMMKVMIDNFKCLEGVFLCILLW